MIKRHARAAFIAIMVFHLMCSVVYSQQVYQAVPEENNIPDLIRTAIKGAPVLDKPILIMAGSRPAWTEGLGWAAPAVRDWNKDGKKDLLIGEFGSGIENQHHTGHFIRVYENIGTDEAPRFTEHFSYARPVNELSGPYPKEYGHLMNNGTPISINQFCCMPITPQFMDLNNDGFDDLYTGQYTPGEVTWFRGSARGFFPGEKLFQEGNPGASKPNPKKLPISSPENWSYWVYSAVSFGDFTGDGLADMIVGGTGLRMSKNIGNKQSPKFGTRTWLKDKNGNPLWDEKLQMLAIPYVVDWDNDGEQDLLVTSSYSKGGENVVTFFKGKRGKAGYYFERGIPLFQVKDGSKAFPGEYLNLCVTDWNNDGIKDLLIGTKVALVEGKFDKEINYTWGAANNYKLSKLNPGYLTEMQHDEIKRKIRESEKLENEIGREEMIKLGESATGNNREKYMLKEALIDEYYGGDEKYKALYHKGYVYLLLGKRIAE